MSEKINPFEAAPEQFPNQEEVSDKIEEILDGRPGTEIKKRGDETGIFVWIVETVDRDGDKLGIWYQRGTFDQKIINPRIHTVRYDSAGVPCGAGAQYDFAAGKWHEVL